MHIFQFSDSDIVMHRLCAEGNDLLSINVIKILKQNKILSVTDFLQEEIEKISALTNLSLAQVLSIREDLFTKYSAPVINGTEIIDKLLKRSTLLPTGIQRLDEILNGGLQTGYLTEICGLADAGKTQLCHQISINLVKNEDCSVLYVDTKGDFSAIKIQKILQAQGYAHKDMALLMNRIKVVVVWTMDELIELLKNIKKREVTFQNLKLILIDSLPCLMFQYLGDDSKVGLKLLNIFVNYARFLCKEYTFVCVNIQTRWVEQDVADGEDETNESHTAFKDASRSERIHRCLGRYWQHIPATVLLLEMDTMMKNENNIVVTILNSNFRQSNLRCGLSISDIGVT